MSYSTKFWNLFAKKYAKIPVANQQAYQEKLRLTQALFTADSTVLEFGCGTGSTAITHASFVKSIVAIDSAQRMIDIANEKSTTAGIKNINFQCSSIENFTSPSTFDVVMAHSILHLLEKPEDALKKVYDLLKPGGYFVSSTVCAGNTSGIVKTLLMIGSTLGLPKVKFLRKTELEVAIEKAGFTLKQIWQPTEKEAVFIIAQKS